jgi:glucose-1-phosphate thymidylyltransferase
LAKETLKIIIPMAGFGTRLRPLTWSKPKPLINVAGKTVLNHVLNVLSTATDMEASEIVFIVGYLGDQVREYMAKQYPRVKTSYYVQEEMLGQSHAISLASEHLQGPTLILFVDTIVDEDMSFLKDGEEEAVIWVKRVEDPRRFGVVEVGEDGYVKRLIEKPETMENDLAVVGIYYFARGEDLLAAIDRQMSEGTRMKGEYFIADAISIMLENGLKLFPKVVDVWLDAGLPETVLSTNQYLLDNGRDNTAKVGEREGVRIHPPVYIHPSAEIANSEIGPHVSIGPGCVVTGSRITDSVLDIGAHVVDSDLSASLIGACAKIKGVKGIINVGDDSEVRGSG